MSEIVVKIHTADNVADLLGVDYKTVLNLIKRGHLRALPGLRHKRITAAELNRYLGVQPAATVPPAPVASTSPMGATVTVQAKPLVTSQRSNPPVPGGIKRESTSAARNK